MKFMHDQYREDIISNSNKPNLRTPNLLQTARKFEKHHTVQTPQINEYDPTLDNNPTSLVRAIREINNLRERYGMNKFSDQKIAHLQNLFHHHINRENQYRYGNIKNLKTDNDYCNIALHFMLATSQNNCSWITSSNVDYGYVDRLGRTALHETVRFNNIALSQSLIHRGTNPAQKDKQGICAIAEAAYHGHLEILRLLVDRLNRSVKSRISLSTHSGNIPLALAAKNGHLEAIKLLISERLGQINGYTEKGNTPLMIAASENHVECMIWLLENGADADLANFNGESSREIIERAAKCSKNMKAFLYQY